MSNTTGALSLLLEWVASNKQFRHFSIEDDPADGIRLALMETVPGDIGHSAQSVQYWRIISRRDVTNRYCGAECAIAEQVADMIEFVRRKVRGEKASRVLKPGTVWAYRNAQHDDLKLARVVSLNGDMITIAHLGRHRALGSLSIFMDEWLDLKPLDPRGLVCL